MALNSASTALPRVPGRNTEIAGLALVASSARGLVRSKATANDFNPLAPSALSEVQALKTIYQAKENI